MSDLTISTDRWRDPQTERSVLGDLLLHNQFGKYRDAGLNPDHFDRQAHRLIWHAVSELGTEGVPADLTAVRVRLDQHGTLDEVGVAYLWGLTDGEPRRTAEGIAHLVAALDRYRRCRALYYSTQKLIEQLAEDPRVIDNGAIPRMTETLASLQGQSARNRLRLIDDVEMITRPAPPALVIGMIGAGSFNVVFGAPGTYKTFLGVHLGFCIATGRSFFGATVPEPGHIIHILGEGAGSFGARLAAAKTDFGIAADTAIGYYTLPQSVDLLNPSAVGHFITLAQPVAPRMVTIDTVNRCMPVGNESATEDMTRFVAGCDRIRRELDCAVLAVHHTGWDTSRERGSIALRAAVDTLMSLRGSDVVTLSCEKQRDLDPFQNITLRPVPMGASCVLRLASEAVAATLSSKQGQAFDALDDAYDGSTAVPSKTWRKAAGLPESTFERIKKALLALGRVEREKGKYRPVLT